MQRMNKSGKFWDKLSNKKNLKSEKALEAVKQDGCALRYVSEQIFKNK